MKETQLATKFRELLKKQIPTSWYYKIPDTGSLGGKKPFDGILVYGRHAWGIEFKVSGNKLTKYQAWQKRRFTLAGGKFLVITEHADLKRLIKLIKILR